MTAAIHARFAHRVDGLVHSHPWSIEATVEGPADAAKVMPADDLEQLLHDLVEPWRGHYLTDTDLGHWKGYEPLVWDTEPTVEEIARRLWDRLVGDVPGPRVARRRRVDASSTAAARCACPWRASAGDDVGRRARRRRRPAAGCVGDGPGVGRASWRDIGAACATTGFFVVVGHGLDVELGALFDAARARSSPCRRRSRSARRWSTTTATPASARPGPAARR